MSSVGGAGIGARRRRRGTSLLLAGSLTALARAVSLALVVPWAFVLTGFGVEDPLVGFLSLVLAYEVGLVVTMPAALPGHYAIVRALPGDRRLRDLPRTVVRETRRQYRSLFETMLRSRLAGIGFSLLLAPVVIALALIVATALSGVLYAVGAVSTPDPELFLYATLGLLFVVRAVGSIPVTFAPLLAVDGTSPTHAWRTSARAVRANPFVGGGAGLGRLVLVSVPFLVGLVALVVAPVSGPVAMAIPVASVATIGALTEAIAGIAQVGRYEQLTPLGSADDGEHHSWIAGLPVPRRPARTTMLALLLVTGLALASGAIRVSDARPNVGPAIADPVEVRDTDELYAVARERTLGTSRNVTVVNYQRNWTDGSREPTLRERQLIDFERRQAAFVAWRHDGRNWVLGGGAYASDGLLVQSGLGGRPLYPLGETRVDGMRVYAAPQFVRFAQARTLSRIPDASLAWHEESRSERTTILEIRAPGVVQTSVGEVDGPRVEYRDGSRIRVWIDDETQRLTRLAIRDRYVVYDDERTEVTDRVDVEMVAHYRYGDVRVERPDGVGFRPAGFTWDLLYY